MKTIIVKLLPKNLRVLLFVIISFLSVQLADAQCTITGTVNSGTLTPDFRILTPKNHLRLYASNI